MTRGWIRLWRKALDNEIIKDEASWHIFTWLLLKVDRTTGKKKTGRFWASGELGMKPTTFYQALKRLEKKYKVVTLVVTGKSTEITLINWHKYQSSNTSDDTSMTHERHINDTLQEVRSKKEEYITATEFKKSFPIKEQGHGFTQPITGKPATTYPTRISSEWEEKAFRYAKTLSIDLDLQDEKGRPLKPRWLKMFKDAHYGIRTANLERAAVYLSDYPRKLPVNEKVKFFFYIYMNGLKAGDGYVATNSIKT